MRSDMSSFPGEHRHVPNSGTDHWFDIQRIRVGLAAVEHAVEKCSFGSPRIASTDTVRLSRRPLAPMASTAALIRFQSSPSMWNRVQN